MRSMRDALAAPLAALRGRMLAWARPRQPESLPVRLDRRRVYVLPTRFGLFYGVLLAAMLLGALNYNNNPALLLGLLLAGTGSASTALISSPLNCNWAAIRLASPAPASSRPSSRAGLLL